MERSNPNIIYKTRFLLTSDQVKKLEEATEILKQMNLKSSKNKLGMIIAQVFPEGDYKYPEIQCAVVPAYKAGKILKIIWQRPSGKIRRRSYFEIAKKGILKYFKIKPLHGTKQYWKESDQNMTGNPSGYEDDIPF